MTRRRCRSIAAVLLVSTNVDAFCCRGVRPQTIAVTQRDISTTMAAESPSMFLPRAVESAFDNVKKSDGGKWPPAPAAFDESDSKNTSTLGFELQLSTMPSAPGGGALEDENGGPSGSSNRGYQSRRQRQQEHPREPLTISPTEYMRIPALKNWIPSLRELENKSAEELREMCILRGLSKDGSTEQLQDRLQQWIMRERSGQLQLGRQTKTISESFLFPDTADSSVKSKESSSASSSTVPDSLQAWRRSKQKEQQEKHLMEEDEDTTSLSSVEDWNQAWAQRSEEERDRQRSDIYGRYNRGQEEDLDDDDIEPMSELEALSKTEEILERGEEIDRLLAEDDGNVLDDEEAEDERYEEWAKVREEQLLRRSEELLVDYGIDLFEDEDDCDEDTAEMTEPAVATAEAGDDLVSTTWKELYERGQMEHAVGNVAAATRLFKAGLKLEPSKPNLHMALGDVYRGAMLYQMAQMSYHRALKYAQDDEKEQEEQSIQAMTGLAYVAFEKRNEEECRHYLRMAAMSSTSSPRPWMTWARFEEAEGNIDKAKSIIATTLESLTTVSDSAVREEWITFFDNWLRLERATESKDSVAVDDVFRRATGLFPNQWTFYDAWAGHRYALGETESAQDFYRMAIELSRLDDTSLTVDPIRHHAQDKMAEGEYDEARSILASAAEEDSSDGVVAGLQELYFVRAICEWHLGDLDQAKELFEMAIAAPSFSMRTLSVIYYGRASLEVVRGNLVLAQHFLGLAWKESSSGNSKMTAEDQLHRFNIWKLWKRVAMQLEQPKLADECQRQIDRLQDASIDLEGVLRSLPLWSSIEADDSSSSLPRSRSDVAEVLTPGPYLERDPWANHLALASKYSIGNVRLPELPPVVLVAEEKTEERENVEFELKRTVNNGRSKY